MQLNHFKEFVSKVISEGNRLQKYDINGKQLTSRWFTHTQILSILISITALVLLPKGFTDNFSGYTISFLGIFVGLFSNIVISMYDKRKNLLSDGIEDKNEIEKARIKQLKNYLVQFTGLTSYSILLALSTIIMLLISLSHEALKTDIRLYTMVDSFSKIKLINLIYFFQASLLIVYRFCIIYLLSNFFCITTFSITSYFTFLSTEYKKIDQ
jgi:hypothetical protein